MVDRLRAIRLMHDIWDGIPTALVENCLHSTGILRRPGNVQHHNDAFSVLTLQVEFDAVTCVFRTQVVLATEVLRLGEDKCLEIPMLEHLASLAVTDVLDNNGESNCDEKQASVLDSVSLSEKLCSVVIVWQLLEEAHDIGSFVLATLNKTQRVLRSQRQELAKQPQLRMFFNKIKDFTVAHSIRSPLLENILDK